MVMAPDLFSIIPLLIGVIFVVVVVTIGFRLLHAVMEWSNNNQQPVQALAATVRAKRMDVQGLAGDYGGQTNYFVTFEFPDGTRREVRVSGERYGQMAEGDTGTVTLQGTRFHSFIRRGIWMNPN